jgi:hypothetical protein
MYDCVLLIYKVKEYHQDDPSIFASKVRGNYVVFRGNLSDGFNSWW